MYGEGQIRVTHRQSYDTHVRALAAGEYHALALLDDGRVLTWGTGAGARLPVRALELGGVATAVAAGYQHSLAIVNASGGCGG